MVGARVYMTEEMNDRAGFEVRKWIGETLPLADVFSCWAACPTPWRCAQTQGCWTILSLRIMAI